MNQRELCSKLEIEYDSRHKSRQLDMLKRTYNIVEIGKDDYEFNGQLTEVEILERNKSLKKNKLYLEPLIYTYLLKQDGNVIEKKLGKLLEEFAMVNKDYYFAKYELEIVDKLLQTHSGVDIFIRDSEPYLKRILYEVLVDMEDRCLISLEYIPHACYYYSYEGSNKKYVNDKKISMEDADLYEKYNECYRLAMKEYGYDKKSKIKWYDILNVRRKTAELFECDYIYFAYKIIINKHGIEDYILNDYYGVLSSHNDYIQNKIRSSRTDKRYKYITDDELDLLVDYFISTKNRGENLQDMVKEFKEKLLENKSY